MVVSQHSDQFVVPFNISGLSDYSFSVSISRDDKDNVLVSTQSQHEGYVARVSSDTHDGDAVFIELEQAQGRHGHSSTNLGSRITAKQIRLRGAGCSGKLLVTPPKLNLDSFS